MGKKWNPFTEADERMNKYKYFFPRDEISKMLGHPQVFEDWLHEHSPDNYCYVWVWDPNRVSNGIVGDLVGVVEKLVLALKLMTGIDPILHNNFVIRKGARNEYKMYSTSTDYFK